MSNELEIPEDDDYGLPIWAQILTITMLAAMCIWGITNGHML